MKCLITGGSSLLGRALLFTKPANVEVEATWYTNYVGPQAGHQLNITDKSQVRYLFDRVQPELVIHCAANGSVDFAEKNYSTAALVNVDGTENILLAARDYYAKIIYISTNAVFDGENSPYSEASECHPINAYGSIKRQAELKVIQYRSDWQIIRPFLLYGWPWPGGRPNWATLVLDKLSKGESLKLVRDVIWQPTYAQDCARAIWQLSIEAPGGVYHVASDERVTLYEFGQKVAKVWGLDAGLLRPVGSEEFTGMAPRPRDTTYNLDKIKGLGVELDGIEAGLEQMKAAAAAIITPRETEFEKSQLNLTAILQKEGLKPENILGGVSQGLDASSKDLLEATAKTVKTIKDLLDQEGTGKDQ
jgi:dTDP-4-dehydrorhamnose reductase